jgi:hypothetical protein
MSVFGWMSKGERNSVKIRVRSAMAAQAESEILLVAAVRDHRR